MNEEPIRSLGKFLMFSGAVVAAAGAVLFFAGKFFPKAGRLPGDIFVEKGNFSFYFPIATCLLISLVLTVIMNLFKRM